MGGIGGPRRESELKVLLASVKESEKYFEEEQELRRSRERGKACALASTLSAKTHHVVQEERLEERERDRARKK